MPRAHRYFQPGYIWHITQRCHNKDFLLKFARDRERWVYWLFEAKKRYDLCVLNYIVTSNHIHLLVYDRKGNTISKSLQLIAGQTAQEYNKRKKRKGAFWEDQYHATAVEQNHHLSQCMVYIDLNMVRAGIVSHPREWKHSGYHEIQIPPERYHIIDQAALLELYQLKDFKHFQQQHETWINEALQKTKLIRDERWTQSLAVGSEAFLKRYKQTQGIKTKYRTIQSDEEGYVLKEPANTYRIDFSIKMGVLSENNS